MSMTLDAQPPLPSQERQWRYRITVAYLSVMMLTSLTSVFRTICIANRSWSLLTRGSTSCVKNRSLRNSLMRLQMIERTDTRGISFGVVYQNTYNTASVKVRKALEAGRFGTVVAASCTMNNCKAQSYYQDSWHGKWQSEGGGTLTTQAVHNLDLLCWFLGQPISATAHTGALTHHIEVEATAAATIEFANGALAAFMSTNSSYIPWSQRMEICGNSRERRDRRQ
jgi:hypothetical protein